MPTTILCKQYLFYRSCCFQGKSGKCRETVSKFLALHHSLLHLTYLTCLLETLYFSHKPAKRLLNILDFKILEKLTDMRVGRTFFSIRKLNFKTEFVACLLRYITCLCERLFPHNTFNRLLQRRA